MRNPCLKAALKELDAAGIRQVEQVNGGKHLQLRWQTNSRALGRLPHGAKGERLALRP